MPVQRKWLTLAAVTFASFATTLDNTVVNVALPSIQTDLHLGRSALEWVVNSYVLAFGMLLLASCSADPNKRKLKYLKSGQHYFDQNKFQETLVGWRASDEIEQRHDAKNDHGRDKY